MTLLRDATPAAVLGVLLLALVALAGQGLLLAGVAVGAAVLLTLVIALGPRTIGTAALVGALFAAPMDDVRPGDVPLITVSDLCFVLGFALLAPSLLRRRAHVPVAFAVGAGVLFGVGLLSSVTADHSGESFLLLARLTAALVVLPLAYAWWSPSIRTVDVLAWAYVGGQVTSTAYALYEGPTHADRYNGLTYHPNFLGLGAMVAVGLLLYLWPRTPARHRWLVLVAGGICAYGSIISGSRASTAVIIGLVVLFPLVERSVLSSLAVLGGGVMALLSLNWLVDLLGPTSAIARLMPSHFGADMSDRAREIGFRTYWDAFLASPVLGEGFHEGQYDAHNAYLQVAVAVGIIGLAGFLTLGWSLMRPLLEGGPLHGLGYLAVAYAVIMPVTPTIWDRNIWAALGLAILASSPAYARARSAVPPEPSEENRDHRSAQGPTHPADDALPQRAAGAARPGVEPYAVAPRAAGVPPA